MTFADLEGRVSGSEPLVGWVSILANLWCLQKFSQVGEKEVLLKPTGLPLM